MALDSREELAISLDEECLRRLGSMADGKGIPLEELVNGILREALQRLEKPTKT